MQCELNYGQSFFIMLGLIPSSILLSSWVVAKFIWLPWMEHLNSLPEPKISYDGRYIITDDDIECLNENKDYKSLKDKTLTEETPEGDIFFRYNHDNEGFEFWCDKIPSYKILETVARKYVKMFSCVDLYIDKREETWKEYWKQKKLEKERKDEEEKKTEEPEDVFAKFQSYNKGDGGKARKESGIIAAKNANKYSYRGKFKEAPMKNKEEKHKKIGKDLSWGNWFKLNSDEVHRIQGADI
jgi:hypothetical protein